MCLKFHRDESGRYRDWAWDAVLALEQLRNADGFSEVEDVTKPVAQLTGMCVQTCV